MEVLRANQQRAQATGPRKKPAIVPFRYANSSSVVSADSTFSHSKLTEIFQNFFVGDGQAVRFLPLHTSF